MAIGWVKSHRQITEWEWYKDIKTCHLFQHLVLTANHEDTTWRGHEIKRGQKITSFNHLSFETGLSVQEVRTALDKLVATHEVTHEPTSQYSLVTVQNYTIYQGNGDNNNTPVNKQSTRQSTNNQHASQHASQQQTRSKEEKNEKNIKNETIYSSVYEHYKSLPLVKHKTLTGDMKKAIDKALKEYNNNAEVLKRMATRHADKLELMKEDNYCPTKRNLTEFYGQKKYESTALICSDYDDGVYEQWHEEHMAKLKKWEELF